MKFTELNLHPSLQKNLDNLKFTEATPIQVESYEPIVSGKDVAGLAQTGTGKTAAFLIPIIQRLLTEEKTEDSIVEPFKDWKKTQFILVLVPTRELADQVHDNVQKLTAGMDFKSAVIYGGTGYETQKQALKDGADFVVSTPGRLIDLYKEHHIDLKQVRAVVFDEADRMFDMGFKDDMAFLLERVPRDRQYLVYSATLDFEVLNAAYEFGAQPVEVNISKDETKAENVTHEILHVGQNEKPQFLLSLIKKHKPTQLIIFTNYKSNVDKISQFLNKNNIRAHGISSLLNQKQRNRIMTDFKEAKVPVLVATDVAARGLDVKGVDLILNFDMPDDSPTYVHRIGRTGRAEATGLAFSLVSDRDVDALGRIEKLLGDKISIGWIENDEIIKDFEAFPEYVSHKKLKDIERKKQSARKTGQKQHSRGDRRQAPRKKTEESKEEKFSKNRKRKPKSFKEVDGQVHRDRKSGRHSGKKSKAKKTSKNTRTRVSGQRKKTSSIQPAGSKQAQPGVAQKIKGLIKNLFNG